MNETTNNVAEMTTERIALRKLEAKDIAPMTSILSKIGMKEIKSCFNPDEVQLLTSGKNAEDAAAAVGFTVIFDIAGVILETMKNAKMTSSGLLQVSQERAKEEIAKLPLDTFFELIIEIVQKEEFKDFFKVVSKLFK